MDHFFWDAYQYRKELPDLLDAVTRALAVRVRLRDASLRLHRVGALTLERSGQDIHSVWLRDGQGGVADRKDGGTDAHSVDDAVRAADIQAASVHGGTAQPQAASAALDATRLPITYADAAIGEIHLGWQRSPSAEDLDLCQEFARQCALLAKRYEVQRWTEQRLGRPLLLVGSSGPLLELELFVERAIRSGLPVLLGGEFGTEKALLAASIHGGGPRRDGPFIEINCADPVGLPAQWFEQARGGTLFLSGVDELEPQLQGQIPQHMRSPLGQWLAGSSSSDVRVIAATTADLSERVRDGMFSKSLLAELDFLSAAAPPLRHRPGDIEPLVAAILERHGYRAEHKRTDALIAICKAHTWPDNLFELERVIARLAVMTDGQPIRHVDILRHAPWVAGETLVPGAEVAEAPEAAEDAVAEAPDEEAAAVPEHWVRCALERDLKALAKLHESLKKALLYLGERYAEPISLGQLAQQAHVSPSHLTYLFRSELGTAFKPFLLRIRVHQAREILLADTRMRITEVALSVGFTDLSHFEKSFRRIVGRSPREFRRGGDRLQE